MKSLSNLIKYPFVHLEGKEAYVISAEDREEKFVPLHEKAVSVDDTGELASSAEPGKKVDEKNFISGLHISNAREMLEEEFLKCQEETEAMLLTAREQADTIVLQAQEQAKQLYHEAYETGKLEGYSAGEVDAKERYRELEEQLQGEREKQMLKYQQMIEEIEPRYVEVMIALIQKVTGVLLEERKDILLYLLKNSIHNLDKSTHYIIRVSKEDVYDIESKKQEIKELLGDEVAVEIVEERTLEKNQCIIETDSQMVDCGIQTQLNNLIESLKMLVL